MAAVARVVAAVWQRRERGYRPTARFGGRNRVTVTPIRAVPAEPRLRTRRADRRPLAGRGLVRRRALFERLSAAEPGGVVVVHAPAGSGKTVLLRSWIEEEGLQSRVAWVSVEPDEHDAQRFCLSVADALASVTTTGFPGARDGVARRER